MMLNIDSPNKNGEIFNNSIELMKTHINEMDE